jgi:hypothetical protein
MVFLLWKKSGPSQGFGHRGTEQQGPQAVEAGLEKVKGQKGGEKKLEHRLPWIPHINRGDESIP